MAEIRSINERSIRKVGQAHMTNNVHIFRGLVFCAECGSRMTCSTGRLRKDGFRYSVYSCPVARRSDRCSNHSINDTVLGGFLINYILNMLRAKRNFSSIGSSDQLQAWLLRGNEFADIDHIERTGLNEFFYLLSRYRDDSSYRMMAPKHADTSVVPPEVIALHRERDKQERALKRLQSLYLYSQRAMTEKDFIIKKKEITSKIDEVNDKLGLLTANEEKNLSDEEFMRKASHLLISSYLKEKEYIYFPSLVLDTSPDVLQTYMSTILDSVFVENGKIMRITFANGLRQIFVYK